MNIEGQLWFCPGCGQYVGILLADGSLQIGALVTQHANLVCVVCGQAIYWRRADLKLEALVQRVGGRNGMPPQTTQEINAALREVGLDPDQTAADSEAFIEKLRNNAKC